MPQVADGKHFCRCFRRLHIRDARRRPGAASWDTYGRTSRNEDSGSDPVDNFDPDRTELVRRYLLDTLHVITRGDNRPRNIYFIYMLNIIWVHNLWKSQRRELEK